MITLITPTADRPEAFALCEKWIERQTVPFDQWIVVDDGVNPVRCTMGQTHIKRDRVFNGGESLANNIIAAIPHVKGDAVLIIEDDDWYAPNHIALSIDKLESHNAAGCRWMNYYHLNHGWRRIKNACSTLSNTAFRADQLPNLDKAAKEAIRQGIYHIDRLFWQAVGHDGLHDDVTVIGMKGLPGMPGIGIGHQNNGYRPDPERKILKKWIGEDASYYIS